MNFNQLPNNGVSGCDTENGRLSFSPCQLLMVRLSFEQAQLPRRLQKGPILPTHVSRGHRAQSGCNISLHHVSITCPCWFSFWSGSSSLGSSFHSSKRNVGDITLLISGHFEHIFQGRCPAPLKGILGSHVIYPVTGLVLI